MCIYIWPPHQVARSHSIFSKISSSFEIAPKSSRINAPLRTSHRRLLQNSQQSCYEWLFYSKTCLICLPDVSSRVNFSSFLAQVRGFCKHARPFFVCERKSQNIKFQISYLRQHKNLPEFLTNLCNVYTETVRV